MLERAQCWDQAGFQSGYGCDGHLFANCGPQQWISRRRLAQKGAKPVATDERAMHSRSLCKTLDKII